MAVTIACITVLATSCRAPSLDPRERALFEYWLVCFDCTGQLDSVRAIARRKPASSVAALNQALVAGPPASPVRDSVLGQSFMRDSAWRAHNARPPFTLSRPAYIESQRRIFGEGYQTRGAIGLGWVHDSAAVSALNAALTLPLAQPVHDAVRYAIDSLPRHR
jgi:hypothetical protein